MVQTLDPKPISPYELVEHLKSQVAERKQQLIADINAYLADQGDMLLACGYVEYSKIEFKAYSDPIATEIRREYTEAGWLTEWSAGYLIFKLPGKIIGNGESHG